MTFSGRWRQEDFDSKIVSETNNSFAYSRPINPNILEGQRFAYTIGPWYDFR